MRPVSVLFGLLTAAAVQTVTAVALSSDTVPKITKNSTQNEKNYTAPYFPLLGFKEYKGNPILSPDPNHQWESAYLYNPSAIVIDDRVFLLYRAQGKNKTSSIGLAWSDDGYTFTRRSNPVISPTEPYEIPGGCEDPRVVRVNGTFYATYTGYDGTTARLCLATSTDLVNWKKYGPILQNATDAVFNFQSPSAPYVPRVGWSKSGAIIDERQPDGTYHMHWGDTSLYLARSTDLIHWNFTQFSEPFAVSRNVWEQALIESGPPPIKTRDGMWLKIYNGVATGLGGFTTKQYSTGEMLIDPANVPYGPPIARLETPLLQPSSLHEITGQVDNVIFSEGLVQFRGQWIMYFGQGDEFLGAASTPVQP